MRIKAEIPGNSDPKPVAKSAPKPKAREGVSCTKKMVLISLADHANDEARSIYPSVDKTTQRTGLTARGVRKIVKDLVQDGFLIRVVESHGYHTNEYRIDIEKLNQYAVQTKLIIPEPASVYSEPNPESGSENPEPHTIKPEPRSAESSLTIKNHKYRDAKNASAPCDRNSTRCYRWHG